MSRSRPSVAVIDIGSNSARMIVVERSPSGHLEVLRDARAQLKLMRRLTAEGSLAGALDQTVEVVLGFLTLAEGADNTVAVATAAVREAPDGAAFASALGRRCGIAIEILDGNAEADHACTGAIHGLPVTSGLVFDIGGGSLEIARFFERRRTASWTLPLGALRVSDEHLGSEPPTSAELRRLTEAVERALAGAGVPKLGAGEQLIGTGGTVRAIARIHRAHRPHVMERVHGYGLSREAIAEVSRLVSRTRADRRGRIAGVGSRGDSIVGGVHVVATALDWVGADLLTAAGSGLREGLALRRLRLDSAPLEDIQAASLRALAARFTAIDENLAERRAEVAAGLAQALIPDAVEGVHVALRQASLICDIGRAIDYYNRFTETARCVMVADLAGFGHAELARLAGVLEKTGAPRTTLQHYRGILGSAELAQLDDAAAILAAADEIALWADPQPPLRLTVSAGKRRVTVRCGLRHPAAIDVGGRIFERHFGLQLVVSAATGGGGGNGVPIEVR